MQKKLGVSLLAAAGLMLSSQAVAESWDFEIKGYMWSAGQEGTINGTDDKTTMAEAMEAANMAGSLEATAKYGKFGFYADYAYTDIRPEGKATPLPTVTVDVISKTTTQTFAGSYEVFNTPRSNIDVLVGARYWKADTEYTFSQEFPLLGVVNERKAYSWVDPMVGVKGNSFIGNTNFYADGHALVGGGLTGSERFFDISANLGYQLTDSIKTFVGYRMFDVDYQKDAANNFAVQKEGVQFGMNYAF